MIAIFLCAFAVVILTICGKHSAVRDLKKQWFILEFIFLKNGNGWGQPPKMVYVKHCTGYAGHQVLWKLSGSSSSNIDSNSS